MRPTLLAPFLLALCWAPPALALDWYVQGEVQAEALEAALIQLWPEHEVVVQRGPAPVEGDAVWMEDHTLVLRHEGTTRRAEQVGDAATRVVLVRSWLEAGLSLPPPPPPPPPESPSQAPHSLRAPHLLPGAGAAAGLELSVGAAGTGSLDTDPLEGAAQGYAPVVSATGAYWRLQASATLWNLWEPERSHRPMGVVGLSVLAVDRERWRLAPWVGAAGGWKQTEGDPATEASTAFSEAAQLGFGGVIGAGVALEVDAEKVSWDLSLPLAGWMTWQADEGTAQRPALLLPYPEAGISWHLSDADSMRFGLLASVPSIRWRHDWAHAFTELSAATSVGLGQLGDGDLLLGGALYGRVGVRL